MAPLLSNTSQRRTVLSHDDEARIAYQTKPCYVSMKLQSIENRNDAMQQNGSKKVLPVF